MVLFVETVGVVGAGTMGAQIAEVFALNGKKVVLRDIEQRFVDSGVHRIRQSLDGLAKFHETRAEGEIVAAESKLGIHLTDDQKAAARKKLKPTYSKARVDDAFARIQGTTDLKTLAGCDIVIEAIVEDFEIKSKLFTELNAILPQRSVLATNTSALPVSKLAKASGRPKRFLATHFFNPPTTLPLVEVVKGDETEQETVDDVMNLLSSMRNHRYPIVPVPVKECPAFLVNRVLGAMLEEAYRCLEEGVASARDIDVAMKAGAGLPMGPLELSDMIGLDVILHASEQGKKLGKDYAFVKEPTILRKMVQEGRLGRKSGRGFFEYG